MTTTDTKNTDGAALLPVTQSDREAAAACMDRDYRVQLAAKMRNGQIDKNWLIQAFARHRISHSLPGDVGTAAINQNDAMRQELAHVGNLISDLARAMGVDQANDDGSWPDLAGRIQKLTRAALTPSPCPATQEDAERSGVGVSEPQYLIRKNGAYYRPNAAGYTTSIAEAGRYSLAEAIKHSHPNGPNGPRDGITYEPAPPTPQRQEYDGEAVREALEPFACDDFETPITDEQGWTDFGLSWSKDRIRDWFGPSEFRRAREVYRAALAHPAQATPSALSGDAGEVETTVAAIVAHLRTRADGFRAAAKKQGKRVGPMAKGFDWAALEIESTFAALPSHKGAGE